MLFVTWVTNSCTPRAGRCANKSQTDIITWVTNAYSSTNSCTTRARICANESYSCTIAWVTNLLYNHMSQLYNSCERVCQWATNSYYYAITWVSNSYYTPPAPMNHVKYLRAGPAEMPFRNWYTANTNHFHLTDSVRLKWKTQPYWVIKPVTHDLVRRIRFWRTWF